MRFDLNGYRIHYNDRNNRRKRHMTKWGWEPERPAHKKKTGSAKYTRREPQDTYHPNSAPQTLQTHIFQLELWSKKDLCNHNWSGTLPFSRMIAGRSSIVSNLLFLGWKMEMLYAETRCLQNHPEVCQRSWLVGKNKKMIHVTIIRNGYYPHWCN